ncbi:MAG TPA: hypothetical protein VLH60_01815, partial [Sedimentisphaerales bacterium]|nr:hypothetical protein [Sedimentisphaerales bacterium]
NVIGGDVTGSHVEMAAGRNNRVDGTVQAGGDESIVMTASGSNIVGGSVASEGDVTMTAGLRNFVGGNVSGANVEIAAGTNNEIGDSVEASEGDIAMRAGLRNIVGGSVASKGDIAMTAGLRNIVGGSVEASEGDIAMTASQENTVQGFVKADAGDVVIDALCGQNYVGEYVTGGNITMTATQWNEVVGNVAGSGNIRMEARNFHNIVGGSVSGSHVEMTAGTNNQVGGDVQADLGYVMIDSGKYTILGGNVQAQTDVTILSGSAVILDGEGDQTIEAVDGKVEISTVLTEKITPGHLVILGGSPDLSVNLLTAVQTAAGNIEIKGLGNIQLGHSLTAGGASGETEAPVYHGVSVISGTGEIYTGTPGNGINVRIQGGSDQLAGIGVGLPHDAEQKAAIVLISNAPLKLGPDAQLIAGGTYYGADGPVDDRAAVKFRNINDWQGVPIDIAVYVQSKNGQVVLNHLGILQVQDLGTVALDAKTGMLLVNQTGAGVDEYYLYRLEVAVRDVLWLSEAIANGTHPFASNTALMEALMGGGAYVLRGGVNPEGIEGAWVLHDPTAVQLPALLAQTVEEGCPALLLAAAEEIGQDPEVFRNGLFVNPRVLQPCDTCERLMRSANVLKDVDGSRLAALGQVIGEFATAGAPPSLEQMAAIRQAVRMHVDDGTAYAAAGEWVDALAIYVAILTNEIGMSQADAIAVAQGRYGFPENENVAAFIALTLAELAG